MQTAKLVVAIVLAMRHLHRAAKKDVESRRGRALLDEERIGIHLEKLEALGEHAPLAPRENREQWVRGGEDPNEPLAQEAQSDPLGARFRKHEVGDERALDAEQFRALGRLRGRRAELVFDERGFTENVAFSEAVISTRDSSSERTETAPLTTRERIGRVVLAVERHPLRAPRGALPR